MRELEPPEQARLHKHSMLVTWSSADALHELHGRELLRVVRGHVGADQHEYVQRKMAWYRDLGYEDRARRVRLTFQTPDRPAFWCDLADLGAGLRATVPGEWTARVTDVRFGIEATLHEFGREAGDFGFRAPSQGAVVLQLVSSIAEAPAVPCDLYRASAVFPFLPPEYEKVRIASSHMTCVVSEGVNDRGKQAHVASFAFELPADEAIELGALGATVATMRVLARHNQHPVTVRLSAVGRTVELAPDGIGAIDTGDIEFIETLHHAVRICAWFGLGPLVRVSVPALLDQGAEIALLTRVEAGQSEPAPLCAPYCEPVALGEPFGAAMEVGLSLPEHTLGCFIGAYGQVTGCEEVPGLGARITIDSASIIVEKVVVGTAAADDGELDRPRAAVLERLRSLGCARISNSRDPSTLRRGSGE